MTIADLAKQLDQMGLVIVPHWLSASKNAATLRVAQESLRSFGEAGLPSSRFTCPRSIRTYDLESKDDIFRSMARDPLVIELVRTQLGDAFTMHPMIAGELRPGARAQPLHRDDELAQEPGLRCIVAMWALTDFTVSNGATRFEWPDGHRLDLLMPAGSLALWRGELVHGGGANRSTSARISIAANYWKVG